MSEAATQRIELLKVLKAGNRITPLEALRTLGIGRLAARVWDLKREGWQIEQRMIEVGDGARVAQYWLKSTLKSTQDSPGSTEKPVPAPEAPKYRCARCKGPAVAVGSLLTDQYATVNCRKCGSRVIGERVK
jgi:DNA-directed RNA polymerase subunit RPC12/RpoP